MRNRRKRGFINREPALIDCEISDGLKEQIIFFTRRINPKHPARLLLEVPVNVGSEVLGRVEFYGNRVWYIVFFPTNIREFFEKNKLSHDDRAKELAKIVIHEFAHVEMRGRSPRNHGRLFYKTCKKLGVTYDYLDFMAAYKKEIRPKHTVGVGAVA